jgi:hypothetical protein
VTEMLDRITEAIRKEIGTRHQGLPKGGWDGLMRKAAAAAVEAMREPTTAMNHAGYYNVNHSIEGVGDLAPPPEEQPRLIWQAMIDAAVADSNGDRK